MISRTQQILISKQKEDFKRFDVLCFQSKNLYNFANFFIRQSFIQNRNILSYFELYKKLQNTDDYKRFKALLGAQSCQQILKILSQNWKSFLVSMKDWKKNPTKYLGRPKIPKYLHKEKGRLVLTLTNQQIRIKENQLLFPKKLKLKPLDISFLKDKIQTLQQVRIVPKQNHYSIEIIYKKEIQHAENIDSSKILGLDLGINNLVTGINAETLESFIVKGKGIKSLNQFYNKRKAELQQKKASRQIKELGFWRTKKLQDLLHKTSRFLVNYCLKNNIGTIIIGKNKGWKQKSKLGKKNNQHFISIPFDDLIRKIQYKAEEIGIKIILQEESYTSITDHLSLEPMKKLGKRKGKRIKRGLFQSSNGKTLNADVNGAIGIIRKVVGDTWIKDIQERFDRGMALIPFTIVLSERL